MNENVAQLSPSEVWTWFEKLNEVPRPSKKEERVIAFMQDVGKQLGLETIVDDSGNVIIKKPATKGKENVTGVILQAHLDMVHQKNADTKFDFLTQGIESVIEGDWVKAKGTTLGSDNGMGVASILAVLASKTIEHGPIEGLFTIDEETGMTGAENLQQGHSGCEIHLGRGNANKLMNRILLDCGDAGVGFEIASIAGGSLRNAIPRESFAVLNVADEKAFRDSVNQSTAAIKDRTFGIDQRCSLRRDQDERASRGTGRNVYQSFAGDGGFAERLHRVS